MNDTAMVSEDTDQIRLSSNNEITVDKLQTSEDNTILAQANDDETASAENWFGNIK